MPDTTSLSFRVASEKAERLDRLAVATDRPKSWLLEQALDAYLEVQAWQVEQIKAGLDDADNGRVVSHDKVTAWLDSWGTDDVLDPPR